MIIHEAADLLSPAALAGQWGAAGLLGGVLGIVGKTAYNRERDRADAAEKEVARLNEDRVERAVYLAEKKRADDAVAEVARLNAAIIDRYVPALETQAGALADAKTLIVSQTARLEVLEQMESRRA